MTEQERLLTAAKRALRWFTNYSKGTALNGMHDDLIIGQELRAAIEAAEQRWDADTLARELVDRR